MTTLNFPRLRNAENPAFLGPYSCSMTKRMLPVFKQHETFGSKNEIPWLFYDLGHFFLKSMTFQVLENVFSNSNTFHDCMNLGVILALSTYSHWEIWMLLIVDQNISDTLVNHGEEWLQCTHAREIHHMLLLESVLQTLDNQAAWRKVLLNDIHKIFLQLERKVAQNKWSAIAKMGTVSFYLKLQTW